MKTFANIFGIIAGIIMFILGGLAVAGVVYTVIEAGFEAFRFLWKGFVIGIGFFIAGVGAFNGAAKSGLAVSLIIGIVMAILEWKVWTGIAFVCAEIILVMLSENIAAYLLLYYDYVIIGVIVCCAVGLIASIVANATSKK